MHPTDHFGSVASCYQQFRPTYPNELFDWLCEQLEPTATSAAEITVWDVGCGNGQASNALAKRGLRVLASDSSVRQLQQTRNQPTSTLSKSPYYFAARAEQAPLADQSLNAITVAQAAHWFQLPVFYREANRLLKPGGLLAMWSYGRPQLPHGPLNDALFDFHAHWLSRWWPAERKIVDEGYRRIRLPQPVLATPSLYMQQSWNLKQLLGYASSWSATKRCQQSGLQPIAELENRLRPYWPVGSTASPTGHDTNRAANQLAAITVQWPLAILACRLP